MPSGLVDESSAYAEFFLVALTLDRMTYWRYQIRRRGGGVLVGAPGARIWHGV